MKPFWMENKAGRGACALVETEEQALAMAAPVLGEVNYIGVSGYPARPRLDDKDGWGAGETPSFCIRPRKCSRRGGSCVNPNGRSCTA